MNVTLHLNVLTPDAVNSHPGITAARFECGQIHAVLSGGRSPFAELPNHGDQHGPTIRIGRRQVIPFLDLVGPNDAGEVVVKMTPDATCDFLQDVGGLGWRLDDGSPAFLAAWLAGLPFDPALFKGDEVLATDKAETTPAASGEALT